MSEQKECSEWYCPRCGCEIEFGITKCPVCHYDKMLAYKQRLQKFISPEIVEYEQKPPENWSCKKCVLRLYDTFNDRYYCCSKEKCREGSQFILYVRAPFHSKVTIPGWTMEEFSEW